MMILLRVGSDDEGDETSRSYQVIHLPYIYLFRTS